MKKEKTVDELLALFEKHAMNHGEAMASGNSRKANYSHDKILEAVHYLKKKNKLEALVVFYNHSNMSVRSWAACFLLPMYEKKSLKILKEIAGMNIPSVSFDAKMVIQEWKNGHLKDFYTL